MDYYELLQRYYVQYGYYTDEDLQVFVDGGYITQEEADQLKAEKAAQDGANL